MLTASTYTNIPLKIPYLITYVQGEQEIRNQQLKKLFAQEQQINYQTHEHTEEDKHVSFFNR